MILLSAGTAAVLYTSPASSNTAPASSNTAPVAASTNSSKSAPVSTVTAPVAASSASDSKITMIPSNFSKGYNSAALNPFPANGPNAFAYKIGTVDRIGQLMTDIPTSPGSIFKVNMLIGDLRIFNPTQPANTGNITTMPWDGGQFLMDDLKTPTPEQVITIKPSLYWSDITFNVSFTKASKVYFIFGTNATDTIALQKVTITPLNTSKESDLKPGGTYPATCKASKSDPYFKWILNNVDKWTDGDRNQVVYMLNAWGLTASQAYDNNRLYRQLNACSK